MQTLEFLGRGSYFNKSEPSTSAFYKKGGKLLLIDCGFGVLDALEKHNVLNGVKDVFVAITHLHKDHVEDLPKLIKEYKIQGIIFNIIKTPAVDNEKLFSFENTDEKYGEYVASNLGLVSGFDYNLINLDNKKLNRFIKADYKEVPHVDSLTNVAFMFNIEGKKIFYSGDCNNIPFSIKGFDEYYIECSLYENDKPHMSVNELKKTIKENNIKQDQLSLMHFEKEHENKLHNLGFKTARKYESCFPER